MADDADNSIAGLVDHLFRHQAGKMVSTLTRIFGAEHLDLAEEVVQEAMMKALQVWSYSGIPDNPAAWLVQVAKNRALDVLRREANLRNKSTELLQAFSRQETFAHQRAKTQVGCELLDDVLNMMFMACHPAISRAGRLALTLKTVGGFGVSEIARAFLAKEATIAKRLARAKRQIRESDIIFALPSAKEMSARLDWVLEVLYLLFNEGYTAHRGENLVRRDLCEEAVRLGKLVIGHPATALPKSHALLALMYFQAARLAARIGDTGELFLLSEQDRWLWDRKLIAQGFMHLDRSAAGEEFSEYHLQAGIAACHAAATSYEQTDWAQIVKLYDQLLAINPSPVVGLNRAVALAKWRGAEAGIRALEAISEHPALSHYYLLPATLGELWAELGERERAASQYRKALDLPCSEPERRFLTRRLEATASK